MIPNIPNYIKFKDSKALWLKTLKGQYYASIFRLVRGRFGTYLQITEKRSPGELERYRGMEGMGN